METSNLLVWQWNLYAGNHRDRQNLALHLATVPLFDLGVVTLVTALVSGRGALAAAGALAMVPALIAQGRGHRREAVAPVPFSGPVNFVARFLAEQLVTFPRYVLSGGLRQAWREAA